MESNPFAGLAYWISVVVALAHGALVIAVICGSVAAVAGKLRHHRTLEIVFYGLIASLIASDVLLGECALTGIEKLLRERVGPDFAYSGSFIGHYAGFLPPEIHAYGGPILVAAAIVAFPVWRMKDRLSNRNGDAPVHAGQDPA